MSNTIGLLIVFVGSTWGTGCPQNRVLPPDEPKSPREYSWIRETIGDGSFQSLLSGLWGSSPQDVYVVGHSSDPASGKKIWRFNGLVWSDISMVYYQAFSGQPAYNFSPSDVFGFSQNNVWIVGSRDTSALPTEVKKGFIIRFNGTSWNGTWLPTSGRLTTLWGVDSSNVWIGGHEGQLFCYNGSIFQEYQLPDSIIVHHIEGVSANEVYAGGIWFPSGQEQIRYYRWDGVSWNRVESRYVDEPDPGFDSQFAIREGTIFSSTATTVTKRNSSESWQIVHTDPNANIDKIRNWGASGLAAIGSDLAGAELVLHNNGTDWARITYFDLPNAFIGRTWSDGKHVFLTTLETSSSTTVWPKSFVIRSK